MSDSNQLVEALTDTELQQQLENVESLKKTALERVDELNREITTFTEKLNEVKTTLEKIEAEQKRYSDEIRRREQVAAEKAKAEKALETLQLVLSRLQASDKLLAKTIAGVLEAILKNPEAGNHLHQMVMNLKPEHVNFGHNPGWIEVKGGQNAIVSVWFTEDQRIFMQLEADGTYADVIHQFYRDLMHTKRVLYQEGLILELDLINRPDGAAWPVNICNVVTHSGFRPETVGRYELAQPLNVEAFTAIAEALVAILTNGFIFGKMQGKVMTHQTLFAIDRRYDNQFTGL